MLDGMIGARLRAFYKEVVMFSHVILGTNDIEKSRLFYDAVLGTLGANPGVVDDKGRLMFVHDDKIFGLTPLLTGNRQPMVMEAQ